MSYKVKMLICDIDMYQAYFTSILMSVNQIINVYPQLAKGYESIVSVSEVLYSKESVEYKGDKKVRKVHGHYKFENVNFQYKDSEKHVVSNFNLEIDQGESVAFVGESGAGKSTI